MLLSFLQRFHSDRIVAPSTQLNTVNYEPAVFFGTSVPYYFGAQYGVGTLVPSQQQGAQLNPRQSTNCFLDVYSKNGRYLGNLGGEWNTKTGRPINHNSPCLGSDLQGWHHKSQHRK